MRLYRRFDGNPEIMEKMFLLIIKKIKNKFFLKSNFKNSKDYWNKRYIKGGNSGSGSYNHLAVFKAEVINEFIINHKIEDAIEFGCGDGNQLKYINYPKYLGFDVSKKAVEVCEDIFKGDDSKSFKLMENYGGEQADLTLSLEVIFHIVENNIFNEYMKLLFSSSKKYVIIYSSNTDENKMGQSAHVKHRNFTQWITDNNIPFQLIKKIDNKFPFDGSSYTSFSDFYIYKMN